MEYNNQVKSILLIIGLIFSSSGFTADQSLDDVREEIKQSIKLNDYTSQYGQMLAFETEPDLSGSSFNLNDEINSTMDIYKIPLQTKLFSTSGNNFYGRIGFNYATVKSNNLFSDEQLSNGLENNKIKSKWETFSGTIGLIADIPVSESLTTTFAIDAGIARLENDSSYYGNISLIGPYLLDELFLNWSTNASVVSGVAGLKYKKTISTNELDLQAIYTHSYVSSFSESNDYIDFTTHTDTIGLIGDIIHPLNSKIMGYPLSGIIHTGYTAFLGNNRDALGFSYYAELGYSIRFDISNEDLPLKSFNIGAKGIRGDNKVNGWSVILGYNF